LPSLIIKNPHKDDETLLTRFHLTTVTFQTTRESLVNGQKTLQEWNRRWGMGINFLHRAANAFLGINPPADRRIQKEILDMA